MAIIKTLWEGMRKIPQARVRNLMLLLATVGAVIAITLNLSFGYNTPVDRKNPCRCSGWWIEWNPAATITVDLEKKVVQTSGGN